MCNFMTFLSPRDLACYTPYLQNKTCSAFVLCCQLTLSKLCGDTVITSAAVQKSKISYGALLWDYLLFF